MAKELKESQGVDFVVVLSHNNVGYNKELLQAAPDVDVIVGAHDHLKLVEPEVVSRSGAADGWVVEAGFWGHYLGQLDIEVSLKKDSDEQSFSGQNKKLKTPKKVKTSGEPGSQEKVFKLAHYKLHQIDSKIPEDPFIKSKVDELNQKIIENFGSDIFHDHVADCEFDVSRTAYETPIGNLLADAYLKETNADFAIDSTRFIYGELHPGELHTVDFYHVNPAIYNPDTQKNWTLKVLPMTGKLIKWLFYFFLSIWIINSWVHMIEIDICSLLDEVLADKTASYVSAKSAFRNSTFR